MSEFPYLWCKEEQWRLLHIQLLWFYSVWTEDISQKNPKPNPNKQKYRQNHSLAGHSQPLSYKAYNGNFNQNEYIKNNFCRVPWQAKQVIAVLLQLDGTEQGAGEPPLPLI